MKMKDTVKITERGWAGHFICADRCLFRRNTLVEYEDIKIVVSTVGNLLIKDMGIETVGHNRYYETMAFHSDKRDKRFFDINVSRQVHFDSEWAIGKKDADDKANDMHETVVVEISNKLLSGYKFK